MIVNVLKKAFLAFGKRQFCLKTTPISNINPHLLSFDYNNWKKVQPIEDKTDRKYVFIGIGSIGRPAVHFLHEFIKVDYKNVYMIDAFDLRNSPGLKLVFEKGAKFIQKDLKDEDWNTFFDQLDLKPFDVVIDLTTDTDGLKIIELLRRKSVMYLNTAQEVSQEYTSKDIYEISMLKRRENINKLPTIEIDSNNTTQIFDFGMNPGVISHFALQGLMDVAKHVLNHKKDPILEKFVEEKKYNLIAKHLDLHTIQSSELDTQIAHNVKKDGTFYCT